MKKYFVTVFLLVFIAGYAAVFAENPQFSEKEKAGFELIKQVKEFEKTLPYSETENFKNFSENDDTYNILYFNKKTEMPFNYFDPKMQNKEPDCEKLEDNFPALEEAEGINPEEYDFFLYHCQAMSGGTVITRRLLNAPPERIVYVILHEDWHDTIGEFPLDMNEASADFIGIVGMAKFFKKSEKEVNQGIKDALKYAETINNCHEKLSNLADDYAAGKIDLSVYREEKEKVILRAKGLLPYSNELNSTRIAHMHTYTYYFPLMFQLFRALNSDLSKFMVFMENLDWSVPPESVCPFIKEQFESDFETMKIQEICEEWLKNMDYFDTTRIQEIWLQYKLERTIENMKQYRK